MKEYKAYMHIYSTTVCTHTYNLVIYPFYQIKWRSS